MVRRSPGRTCSSDGTFRLMSRTITDANVLVLIIGDDHCIVAYYVMRAEMWADLVPGRKWGETLTSVFLPLPPT